ncbi:NAD(P)H-hydrate dehydratase [Propionivibrio dicarboxylicus]|nr:NAD(P)H-hydrate dehydratase [Propionivibrio dicarboxylicus]
MTFDTALPLYRSADLRHIESAAADQKLMQRAGRAAADWASQLCDNGGAILVLAGPGNNGGDAFDAARRLRAAFFDVELVFPGDPERLPADAAAACKHFLAEGGRIRHAISPQRHWSLIIDGLFGIGLTRDITGPYAGLIDSANALADRDGCPLLALDCPSGLDADTGVVRGAVIRASHTLSFIAAKPGLFTGDGPDCCGNCRVAALDLDAEAIAPAAGRLVGIDAFAAHLRPRRRNSHKGSYGNAGILGGAPGMTGAALLAARAALRLGSGRVYVALLDAQAPALDPCQPELMLRRPDALHDAAMSALACGPGLGTSIAAKEQLVAALRQDIPLVLDADALNLLARECDLPVAVALRQAPTLLTPHPAEAARLLERSVEAIQSDRIGAAQEIAERFNALVALKGCGTVLAHPDGQWRINANGNPGLATAGSGDVLTGIIVALLAQGWDADAALAGGVHLHGAAADRLVDEGLGPVGLTAGELIDSARYCLNDWIGRA